MSPLSPSKRSRWFRPSLETLEDRINPVSFGNAVTAGSTSLDIGFASAADVAGNVYVTGIFDGTVDFDSGPGTTNLTSAGANDVFIAKYDVTGALVWADQVGGVNSDYGYGIAVDGSGNVYVTGFFRNAVADFDPGPGTFNLTPAGLTDVFVLKLDGAGNFLWARQFGGSGDDQGTSIAVDATGNVLTTGSFNGTADFDPGAGTFNLAAAAGSQDVFVSKLDSAGNFLWACSVGNSLTDVAEGIAVDTGGLVYVTGMYDGVVDFDPGAGTRNITSRGGGDVFVFQLDSSGLFRWASSLGGTGNDHVYDLDVDGSGNVYTSGVFTGTADFDPGGPTFNLTSAGSTDVFVSKLNAAGNFVWARAFGGTGVDNSYDVTLNFAGEVLTTGAFRSTVDFDPGAGTFNQTSTGSDDVFVSKLDNAGNFVWATQFGGLAGDVGYGLAADPAGRVFISGYFSGITDFDPGAGVVNFTSAGAGDIFVSQLLDPTTGFPIRAGSTNNDAGQSVATDALGNVYVAGYFEGTMDLDPGLGMTNVTSSGQQDVFVAKYSSSGALVWARSVGGTMTDIGYGIAVDAAGNAYVTGSFTGTGDFDPGPGTFNLTSRGSSDIFGLKLDSAGNFLWAAGMGGTSSDWGNGIALDGSGSAYITGRFSLTADFDPGPGTFNLANAGAGDAFVVRLDSAGNFAWAAGMGGTGSDYGAGVSVDAAGNVYTTGRFTATADFDPGAGTANFTTAGLDDIFVSKLDNAGNFVWAHSFGGTNNDRGYAIAVDLTGNLTITGSFSATVDFDPGAGTSNLTSFGLDDIFITRLDSGGNLVWARGIGGISADIGMAVAVDSAGNAYTTGFFQTTADFDPGLGTFNLTFFNAQEIFVSMLDGAGNFVYASKMGGDSSDEGFGIAVDNFGGIYTTGIFGGLAELDPGPGTIYRSSTGLQDMFLAKLVGVSISQSGGSTSLAEGGATDTATVVLNSLPTADVLVTLTPNSQVTVSPTILTFTTANWNVAQTLTLTAVDDAMVEGNHNGVLSFTTSSTDANYNAVAISSLSAAITDNDVAGAGVTITESAGSTSITEGGATDTYTVVLNSVPTANVTIGLGISSQYTTSPTTLIFTPVNWNAPQVVTVTAVDDVSVEGTHTTIVTHTATSTDLGYNGLPINGVTANITDNDVVVASVTVTPTAGSTDVSEAGLIDSYTIVLNTLPTADVVVTVNAGAQFNVSPTMLTFTPANWNVAQAVVVQAIDDAIAQGTRSQTLGHTASSGDARYNGLAVAGIMVNLADNDTAGMTVSASNVDVSEGGSSNTYTVVLNTQPTANVILALAGDSQVSLGNTTLIFTPVNWNVPQVVSLSAIDDALAEGLHNGLITHTAASADAAYSGMVRNVTARIADNDNPGMLISQTNGPLAILEGSSKTYTAVLNAPPASDVVLNIAPDAQVSVNPSSITFTPGDWSVPRPVVVTAVDDGDEEGDHLGRITHTTSSASSAFNNLVVAGVTAGIVDNDGAAIFGTERADSILIHFTAGDIKVTVSGKTTSLPGTLTQLLLYAGGGNDSIQILAPTIPVVIVGGPGVDKVFVTGQTATNNFIIGDSFVTANGLGVGIWESESLTVSGKAGNDRFTVQGVPAFPVEIKGDVGTDVVVGPDRANSWQITGTDAGILNRSIKLSAIENWTGGASVDTFAFNAGKSLTGRIDGGAGQNTLDYSTATAAIIVNLQAASATGTKGFANITALAGGKGGADKLIGADQDSVWNITGQNTGNVGGLAFRNFENLTGGTGDDVFLVADNQGIKGKIDGAGGADSLDYSAYLSRPVAINLQTKAATNTGGFANLEQFQAGAGMADTLIGLNKINGWSINGPGSGLVAGVAFDGFENLTGGTLADTFTLDSGGDWLGTLSGGSGTDILAAFAGSVNTWVSIGLSNGTLNGRKFAGVEVRR